MHGYTEKQRTCGPQPGHMRKETGVLVGKKLDVSCGETGKLDGGDDRVES